MKTFSVMREADSTGVSGTGRVLDGVVFHTGQVVICWHSEHSSVAIFPDWEAFENVHIKAHPENKTRVVFFPAGEQSV